MDLDPAGPRTVTLADALNFCRHGREVTLLTTEDTFGRWIIWGQYACPHCRRIALDATSHEPHEATISGRRLQVTKS